MPVVSVVMPVFNAEKFLAEAINSILGQTFEDFEFLIFNDGSSDNSLSIMQSYNDSRIKIFDIQPNRGLVKNLNEGLRIASGKYIARMDADDIAYPERFQKQVDFLEQNPGVGACGAWAIRFTGDSQKPDTTSKWQPPVLNDEIIQYALQRCPLIHPTAMFRKDDVRKFDLHYLNEYYKAEDYKFWTDFSKHSKLANLPEVLLKYREHDHNISRDPQQSAIAASVRAELFEHYFDLSFSDDDRKTLNAFFNEKKLNGNEALELDGLFQQALTRKGKTNDYFFTKNLIRSYYENYFHNSEHLMTVSMLKNKSLRLLKKTTLLKYIVKRICK